MKGITQQRNTETSLTPAQLTLVRESLAIPIKHGLLPVDTLAMLRGVASNGTKDDPALTTVEAGSILGMHPESVRILCRKGILPHVRLGWRSMRLRKSDVELFLNSRRVEATTASVEG